MSLRSTLSVALLLAGLVPLAARSETPYPLNPIVVTATRTPLPLDAIPQPTIVITRKEIRESGASTVPGLLRFYAGLDVATSGGPGQPSSLFIRGANSTQTLVLINGVKVNGGNIGEPPLQNLMLDDIQRIVIIEGPTAALYGSDGIGGVIDIITRGSAHRLHAHVGVGGGRFRTTDENAGIADGLGAVQGGLNVSHEQSDGFPPQTASPISAGFTNTTLNAFLRFRIPTGDLELRQWQSTGQTDYVDFNLAPASEDYNDRILSLEAQSQLTSGWSSEWLISRYENVLGQNQKDALNPNQSPDFALTRRYTADWQNNFVLSGTDLLTAGISLEEERTASLVYGTAYDAHTQTRSVYAENDWHWHRYRLLATLRHSDNESFGSHNEWNLGGNVFLTPDSRISLSWGSGFRTPSAEDRYGFGGNPHLAPESSHEVDLGFHQEMGIYGHFSIDLFEDTIRNLIVYLGPTAQYPEGINENIDRAQIRGVDLSYGAGFGPWRLRAEAVLQDPRDLVSGEQLARRSRRSLTTSLHYQWAGGYAGLEWLASGPRPDSPYTTTIDPGYLVTNAVAGVDLSRHWSLGMSVDNLFNVAYTEVAGYNTEGRALFFHVLWHY